MNMQQFYQQLSSPKPQKRPLLHQLAQLSQVQLSQLTLLNDDQTWSVWS